MRGKRWHAFFAMAGRWPSHLTGIGGYTIDKEEQDIVGVDSAMLGASGPGLPAITVRRRVKNILV
jgi:hypothetical protein